MKKAILSGWGRLNETTRNFNRLQTTDIMLFGKHGFDLDGYKIYSHHFKKDGSGYRVSHLFSNNMNSLSFLFIKQYRTYYRKILLPDSFI